MSNQTKRDHILLWDLPVRVCHWLLAACVSFMLLSGYTGNWMQWHIKVGPVVLVLVVFRLVWGVVGSSSARFSGFIRSPARALGHLKEFLRRDLKPEAGHNALGGYVVMAILLLTALQGFSGLGVSDDIFLEGPLYAYVSTALADSMGSIHRTAWQLLGIVVITHPFAILAYKVWAGQNLLGPMVTGRMNWPTTTPRPTLHAQPLWLAVLCALGAGLVVYGGIALLQRSA